MICHTKICLKFNVLKIQCLNENVLNWMSYQECLNSLFDPFILSFNHLCVRAVIPSFISSKSRLRNKTALYNRLLYWHFCKHFDWKIIPLDFFHNSVYQFKEQNKWKWKKNSFFVFRAFHHGEHTLKKLWTFSIFDIHSCKHD